MESVATWEELQEEEENFKMEDYDEWSEENWSEEGFMEAGNIMEELISEVIAFSDLLVGTSLTNNHQHQSQVEWSRDKDDQYLQVVQVGPTQNTVDYGAKVGAVPPHIIKKLLLCGALPPVRSAELEILRCEIDGLEWKLNEIKKSQQKMLFYQELSRHYT